MIRNKVQIGPWISSVFCAVALKITAFCKTSFILGSSCAFFSVAPIIVPLSGMFGGIEGSFVLFAISCIVRLIWSGIFSFHFLAYHIPGLFASLYLSCSHWGLRLLPSVLCMVLFLCHPVGLAAGLYTLLWLIPVGIYLICKKNIFLDALASTFTAHAVGSVIWLYTMPMTPHAWLALIPIVLVERFTYALGIVVAYKVIVTLSVLIENRVVVLPAKSCISK